MRVAAPSRLEDEMAMMARAVDRQLDLLLAVPADQRARLYEAMRHAAIGGGKRLRPLLVKASCDLFNVAEEAALANGRSRILHHDLPLTKGLRSRLAEVEPLAGEIGAQPLLVFLADAGVAAPLDERVRADIPRLMAALVLLAGRVVALLDPDDLRPAERLERLRRRRGGPTRLDVERAARVVDLSL